jgi:hypothetical protein
LGIVADDYQTITRRRLRQFDLRELLGIATCLAGTLALYRDAQFGVANAVVLTCAASVVAWQTKRVERWSDLPFEFPIAGVAVASLAMEWTIAWLLGSGVLNLSTWISVPTDSLLVYLSVPCLLLRLFLLTWTTISALGHCIAKVAKRPLPWHDRQARFSLSGRLALVILSVPIWFSFPLHDAAALKLAREIGARAIVTATLAHARQRRSQSRPVTISSYVLVRLGIHQFGEGDPIEQYYVHYDRYGRLRYRLVLQDTGEWEVRLSTRTMRSKVIGVCRVK